MYKIISNPSGKFQLKEVDQEGNSIRVLPQEFATEMEASKFMGEQEEKKAPAEAGADSQNDTADTSGETKPEEDAGHAEA